MIPGSSVFTLAGVAWKSGHLSTKQMLSDAWEALTFRTSGATDGKTLKVRQRILGAIKGQDAQTLQSLASEVIPKIASKVRPETLEIIHSHHSAGRPTYIVSASPAEIVEPLAEALGMTGGIGTRSEVVNGRYTGEIIGPLWRSWNSPATLATTCRRVIHTATQQVIFPCLNQPSTPLQSTQTPNLNASLSSVRTPSCAFRGCGFARNRGFDIRQRRSVWQSDYASAFLQLDVRTPAKQPNFY